MPKFSNHYAVFIYDDMIRRAKSLQADFGLWGAEIISRGMSHKLFGIEGVVVLHWQCTVIPTEMKTVLMARRNVAVIPVGCRHDHTNT